MVVFFIDIRYIVFYWYQEPVPKISGTNSLNFSLTETKTEPEHLFYFQRSDIGTFGTSIDKFKRYQFLSSVKLIKSVFWRLSLLIVVVTLINNLLIKYIEAKLNYCIIFSCRPQAIATWIGFNVKYTLFT